MKILEYKKPLYYPLLEKVLKYIPKSDFYNKEFTTLPYSYKETDFILNTPYLNVMHHFYIDDAEVYSFFPTSSNVTIPLKLKKGIITIKIFIDEGVEREYVYIDNDTGVHPVPKNDKEFYALNRRPIYEEIFNVTIIAALLFGVIKELKWPWNTLVETNQTLLSRSHLNLFETKLSKEIVDSFQNDSTKLLALRHLLYSKRHALSTKSLDEYIAATMGTRPIFTDMNNKQEIETDSQIIFRTNDITSGKDIHVWENTGSGTRRALCFRIMNNIKHNWDILHESDAFIEFSEEGSHGM